MRDESIFGIFALLALKKMGRIRIILQVKPCSDMFNMRLFHCLLTAMTRVGCGERRMGVARCVQVQGEDQHQWDSWSHHLYILNSLVSLCGPLRAVG